MRRKKSSGFQNKNLKTAYVFSAVVFTLILVSLIFKIIIVIKNSNFDGANRFTLGVFESSETAVLSFSPKNSSIFLLKIKGQTVRGEIGKYLQIPIDATLSANQNITKNTLPSDLTRILFNLKDANTNLTVVDLLRLSFFARTVPPSSVEEKVFLTQEREEIQTIASSYFTDPQIVEDKQSIEIVNSTDIPGLGNRLANLITNMGGNVILVSTADNDNASSVGYWGDKTYTVSKLSSVLGFATKKISQKSIADLIIVIGKNSRENLRF